jgi:hypothetical protein
MIFGVVTESLATGSSDIAIRIVGLRGDFIVAVVSPTARRDTGERRGVREAVTNWIEAVADCSVIT